jgi:hypothetical protein
VVYRHSELKYAYRHTDKAVNEWTFPESGWQFFQWRGPKWRNFAKLWLICLTKPAVCACGTAFAE